MATQNIFDMADTWTEVGTTYAGIKLNVTDTASAVGSLLMDLQVGGASKASISKAAVFTLASGGYVVSPGGVYVGDSISPTSIALGAAVGAIATRSTGLFGFAVSTNASTGVYDTALRRDAAGILAQYNGTNAQAFRVYNTFTDASNYERLNIGWATNVLTIGTAAAGTGTKRNLVLDGANRAVYSEVAADIAAALVSHGIMESA